MKPWSFYSIESSEKTWGYTVYLPLLESTEDTVKYRFKGWTLYPNDGGRVIDCSYGQFSILKFDDEGDPVEISEYHRKNLSGEWVSYYTFRQMIRDLFEKDINSYEH